MIIKIRRLLPISFAYHILALNMVLLVITFVLMVKRGLCVCYQGYQP